MCSEVASLGDCKAMRIGRLNIIFGSIGEARFKAWHTRMSCEGYKERSQSGRSLFSCHHGIVWDWRRLVDFLTHVSFHRSITFFLQALAVGNLPQSLRLFSGEPISSPHASFLNALHSSDA